MTVVKQTSPDQSAAQTKTPFDFTVAPAANAVSSFTLSDANDTVTAGAARASYSNCSQEITQILAKDSSRDDFRQ